MKKVIFVFSVIIFFGNLNICLGQSGTDEEKRFVVVEKMPEYPGGYDALKNDIAKNIAYPAKAKGIEGTVFIRFEVKKDGSIGKTKILRGVDELIDKEAIRVVKLLKKFKPAEEQGGEKVSVYLSVPIKFKLQK